MTRISTRTMLSEMCQSTRILKTSLNVFELKSFFYCMTLRLMNHGIRDRKIPAPLMTVS